MNIRHLSSHYLSLFSHSFLSLSSLFASTLFFDIVAIPFLDVFAKALTLTISSEMAIYIDKYHNTVIGGGESGRKRVGEKEGTVKLGRRRAREKEENSVKFTKEGEKSV